MPVALEIAIAGTGRMGEAVEQSTRERGHKIVERFNQSNPVRARALGCNPDVVIDFTEPRVAISNLVHYCTTNTPVVMGTTGWYDRLSEVYDLVKRHSATVFYSSNY